MLVWCNITLPVAGFFWTTKQLPNHGMETWSWMLGLTLCLSYQLLELKLTFSLHLCFASGPFTFLSFCMLYSVSVWWLTGLSVSLSFSLIFSSLFFSWISPFTYSVCLPAKPIHYRLTIGCLAFYSSNQVPYAGKETYLYIVKQKLYKQM